MSSQSHDAFDAAFPTAPLNQAELDSLFDLGAAPAQSPMRGIDALLSAGRGDTERLPLLEVLFERLVRTLSTALRNFTSDAVEATFERFEATRYDEYANSLLLPLVVGIFKADEWDDFGVVAVDSCLVYAIVDALMGGRRGVPPFKIDGRAFTTLELRFIERMIEVILRELSAVFSAVAPVNFRLDRIETSPRFAAIVRPTSAVAVARLRIDMEDRGGRFSIMLPHSTLEPIRALLLQRFIGEKMGRDQGWATSLMTSVRQVPIELRAVVGERTMRLGEAFGIAVGDTIAFSSQAGDAVQLLAEDVELSRAELFCRADRYVVRLAPHQEHD